MTTRAVGWATVDLDRAATELAGLLAGGSTFEPTAGCVHLGAFCRVGRLATPRDGASLVVLLEPSTEGRLATTLARHDEGWCATWLDDADDAGDDAAALSVVRDGPLGPERLVLGGPVTGPHRLLVTAATIAS